MLRPDPTLAHRLELQHRLDVGVLRHPLLFGQRLRVLFVIDGSISLSTTGFGLGLVLDALRASPWWVRFRVDVARRAPGTPVVNASPGPYDVRYDRFRFDMAGFDLHDYDQVWMFGFQPGNDGSSDDGRISLPASTPLTDAELALLATWMDAGGGVFATGDHHYLGASLCSRVPRVRTMRKWTNAQGVPPRTTPARHDTNQPQNAAQAAGAEDIPFGVERDAVPQPVEVVREPLWSLLPWQRRYAPHPLLCTPHGVVDRFPDHPHEGEVIDGPDVQLDLPPGIDGWSGVEYPGGAGRPRPRVIAYGRNTHTQTRHEKGVVNPKRFGLVGVYDGQAAGVGRVVVDSTWHHWLSLNLVGFRDGNPDVYRLMQHYFRNIGVWLATPAQRSRMLLSATWGVVIGSGPMEFPPDAGWFELGGRALDVLGRTVAPCLITEWVRGVFELEQVGRFRLPDVCLSCPREDLLDRVVLGGVAQGLAPLAFEHHALQAQGGRPVPDGAALAKAAVRGLRRAQEELVRGLREEADGLAKLSGVLDEAARRPDLGKVDLGVRRTKLALQAVQVTDLHDPALSDDVVDVSVRVVVDGVLLASRTFHQVRVPEPERGRLLLRLDDGEPLAELEVWEGSTVEVVVAASPDATGVAPRPDDLRGRVVLDGSPEQWAGLHRGTVLSDDPWRPWLQVEPLS